MNRRKWTDEQFIEAVKSSLSYAEVMRKLNLHIGGSNYDTVKRKIKELNLDTSHMTGKVWNQGERYRQVKKARPLSEILVEHSTFVNTNNLRLKLLKEGVKEHKCECCGRSEWMGKPIALELHHVNGIKDDLRIENLQILCPNCHAFTDNYRGRKQTKSTQKETSDVNPCKFGEILTSNIDDNAEPSLDIKEGVETRHKEPKSKKPKEPKYCAYCGKELVGSERRNKYCSQECAHKANGSKRPDMSELIEKFKELKSFVQVGKFYGVSDNAVRKWCKLYGIIDMVKA